MSFSTWATFGGSTRSRRSLVLGDLPVAVLDALDRDRAGLVRRERAGDAHAVVRDRRVGVGHLERRHALLEAAEQHGGVGGELGADAHPLGEPRPPASASPSCRAGRRPSCRRWRSPTRARRRRVRVLVVRDLEELRALLARCERERCGADAQVLFGSMPSSSARARMNGLKDEPGWRWPFVARLKGRALKSEPPTIARTSPVLVLDRHERGVRADAGEPADDRAARRRPGAPGRSSCGPSGRRANTLPGAVAVEQVLGHPAREVGLLRLGVRRVDVVLGGQALADRRRRTAPA